ncbi:LysE/ArgO family amino acid transporter [Halopseudomonas salina]|uniref:Amino acid transporter LysE n=1 Tax=Halopseudomonas salina TaxID=1323744 RepID=A0ABQ1PK56_9GAMM|nr:LysE/ArgO family amino acid transporter [Halopseudomonas salina]GGC98587.1 amino acid transporter LysE [Halopseudomonas salina]
MSVIEGYLNGLFVAAGLIIAIGAQNAFVLGQSLKREHHYSAALVCMVSDAVLILAGVFGLAALLEHSTLAMQLARWGGVAFLVSYALLALRRAFSPQVLRADQQPMRSRRSVLLSTLAVTLLNPHVYLDTVVLIGAIGAQQRFPLYFAAGAVSASILWFTSLAVAGARLAPWLSRPATWRVIDGGVAIMMLIVAWGLARP